MENKLPTIQNLPTYLSFGEFAEHVSATIDRGQDQKKRQEHWLLGLWEESGEVAGWLKKAEYRSAYHSKHLIMEEIGGLLWYAVAAAMEAQLAYPRLIFEPIYCGSGFEAIMALKLAVNVYIEELRDHDFSGGHFVYNAYCELFCQAANVLRLYDYTLEDAYRFNYIQLQVRRGLATCTNGEFVYFNIKKVRKP